MAEINNEIKHDAGDSIDLILNEHRVTVRKSNLAKKSRYFGSLFSHDFNDSQKREQVVNYDISHTTLKDFADWVEDDAVVELWGEDESLFVKPSLRKYSHHHCTQLLHLLELSVLFMADDLTEDITDVIVYHWLTPEKLIEIWKLARELNLTILRDICFAQCLDQFSDLESAQLSKDEFNEIMMNVNVRATNRLLEAANNNWIQHNEANPIDLQTERRPAFLQCMLASKSNSFVPKETYVYGWDKSCLIELVKLRNLPDSEKDVIGMQVAGRGFSIYTIGGEMGIGTGLFNKHIWRYCLLSKKWYHLHRLPAPRRHMITVFIGTKLYLIGGVGRHRLKLSGMDIFDIRSHEWSKGASVPEEFTEVPPHCVMNGKLYFIKSAVYVYHPHSNHWETLPVSINPVVNAFVVHNTTLFISRGHEEGMFDVIKNIVIHKNNIVIHKNNDVCQFRYVENFGGVMLLSTSEDPKYGYLQVQIRPELREYYSNPRLGYFNVINPSTLYDSIESRRAAVKT